MKKNKAERVSLKIDGDIYFSNAKKVLAQLTEDTKNLDCPIIDMSALSNCDSAGVALLLELKKRHLTKESDICFINPPEQLIDLANFLKVEKTLFKCKCKQHEDQP